MEPTGPNDAELVAKTLAGDCDAFGQLYDRHAWRVRAVVASVSGDWSAVEDMTQESFLRAFRNLGRLRAPERFGSWITGIARRVGRERRRALRRNRHDYVDSLPPVIEPSVDGVQRVQDRDQLEFVMGQLSRLNEQERTAIHMFYFQRQQAERAAELLGMSRSGYYALVARAVARLAALIQSHSTKKKTVR